MNRSETIKVSNNFSINAFLFAAKLHLTQKCAISVVCTCSVKDKKQFKTKRNLIMDIICRLDEIR